MATLPSRNSLNILSLKKTVTVSLNSARSSRSFAVSAEAPNFKDVDPRVRYPKLYFDFKAWQKNLQEKRLDNLKWEKRAVQHLFYKEPPEGWTVVTFLKKMQLSSDEKFIEDFAGQFKTWKQFAGMGHSKIKKLIGLSRIQTRRLRHYLELFNHGLWPERNPTEYYQTFAGKKIENEGMAWKKDEDDRLLASCKYWGIGFGDVWLYVSYDLQRGMEECRRRYIEIVKEKITSSDSCEFVLSKSMQPLLMNRGFRMLPPTCYIIPTKINYQLTNPTGIVPKGLLEYRDEENFWKIHHRNS